jgi:hypothetical protein
VRQIVQAINLRYKGQPTISISVDGVYLIQNQQLPAHNVVKDRRIALPPGGVGYNPQLFMNLKHNLM